MAGAGWPVAGRITPAGRLCAAEAAAARSERGGRGTGTGTSGGCTMTLEELPGDHRTAGRYGTGAVRMEQAGDALEEVLSKALSQRSLTLGVYEAAKLLNVDPDNVVLCLLAADEEEAGDAALQIHFTLIQAFCCENDINILRVSNPARLAQLLLPAAGPEPPADLHCVLVTVSPASTPLSGHRAALSCTSHRCKRMRTRSEPFSPRLCRPASPTGRPGAAGGRPGAGQLVPKQAAGALRRSGCKAELVFPNPHASQWKDPALSQLMCFCRESRYMDQWVPVINLPER
ncbi:hypothetical protein QYF61_001162 [Mycteria americana]|uniref:Growth arrest and DNA damage-inducible protein GADD45 alpha n=1 Tax=Mycteria americana TaxID=33587 RepID=A0AAN7N3U3_MYCAM|nr:hypothetical protein QYF61_001162 [Mycteria americana]